MTVQSYLNNIAYNAILRDSEKESAKTSVSYLSRCLNNYFPGELKEHIIFGSYSRGTILPRFMDEKSDVDYMVVFSSSGYQPQTYLDKLKRFTAYYYKSSEIKQSHPTIQLELNHIRFELVPAVTEWWAGTKIPSKTDGDNWMYTDPTGFNEELVEKNRINNNVIKPLIRVVKYWNACNSYPFESYDLEKRIVNYSFGFIWTTPDLKNYFYNFMSDLNLPLHSANWKHEKLDRAKALIASAKTSEQQGYPYSAEGDIARLLPAPTETKRMYR